MKDILSGFVLLVLIASSVQVVAQSEPPIVHSIGSETGPSIGGTITTINGENFQQGVGVVFGDQKPTVAQRLGSTRIVVITPAHLPGVVDVIVTNPDGQTAVSKGGFTFFPSLFAPRIDYAIRGPADGLLSDDFDSDGKPDVAASMNSRNAVAVLLNQGTGDLATPLDYAAGIAPVGIYSGDLDGDVDRDVVVANANNTPAVSVLLNEGDGTFPIRSEVPAHESSFGVYGAELDGDGDVDLAVANVSINTVSILLNQGDATFDSGVDYDTGILPNALVSADFDGDGDWDLAVANETSGSVSILLNHGDGSFIARTDYATAEGSTSIFSADLDGDGDWDLAVSSFGSHPQGGSIQSGNTTQVLLNHGDGTFAPSVYYIAGSQPSGVFGGDMNGDGDLDLAVTNYANNTVSLLQNTGNGTLGVSI